MKSALARKYLHLNMTEEDSAIVAGCLLRDRLELNGVIPSKQAVSDLIDDCQRLGLTHNAKRLEALL
jgi:hypothetical protein